MPIHIVDTHALIWHFTQDASLSSRARSILLDADRGAGGIIVPSIVLVEFIYLVERHRIPRDLIRRIVDLVGQTDIAYRMVPLDFDVARRLESVDRESVPDMPDRIIAATALVYKVPVLTKDSRLRKLGAIETVW